jgi:hypothetical protein
MKLIREFGRFIADYKPINLYIKGQKPIILEFEKARQKELLVRSIITEIYPGFRGNDSFNVNGTMVSGELLNKAQKNIAILYEIVDIAKSIGVSILTADDLIDFISKYRTDLFSVNGKFFDRVYTRLGGATTKGKEKESESNELFTRFANIKGIKVELKSPDSYQEDIAGVDAYFEHKGTRYTIQTKTLSSITESDDNYVVYISGYFTKIKTHYLVLMPKDSFNKKYIFKGKNVQTLVNNQGVNYYSIPKSDLLYVED